MAAITAADRLLDEPKSLHPEIISTHLSKNQAEQLRHEFKEEDSGKFEPLAVRSAKSGVPRPATTLATSPRESASKVASCHPAPDVLP